MARGLVPGHFLANLTCIISAFYVNYQTLWAWHLTLGWGYGMVGKIIKLLIFIHYLDVQHPQIGHSICSGCKHPPSCNHLFLRSRSFHSPQSTHGRMVYKPKLRGSPKVLFGFPIKMTRTTAKVLLT